jgi:hypothetical protein
VFLGSVALLLLGVLPLPAGPAREVRRVLRTAAPNRADRDANAGGYYEGLIGNLDGAGRDELSLKLQGKPADWIRFVDINACRGLGRDVLQFELWPNLNKILFGRPFTTNALGLRDRETTLEKPANTFRIALLGSSMDMGWGVGTGETYENLFEDWLNAHAARRGLTRRFEVLNFAVAAYSPLQRLESFERKATPFRPDLVIYSATVLDTRLLQIHLCNLLRDRVALHREFLDASIARAGITESDLRLGPDGQFLDKERLKSKLERELWAIDDAILESLADQCRSRDVPLVCIMIPRVGETDAASARADTVARQAFIAGRHGIPCIDLTSTFDTREPAAIEIAPWDDHPNAQGHKLLFRALAHRWVDDPALYRMLFGTGFTAGPVPHTATGLP